MAIYRFGESDAEEAFDKLLRKGSVVAIDNGPTGALVCRMASPLYAFKERPANQALSAWGDLEFYFKSFRSRGFESPIVHTVLGGALDGKAFLRFKVLSSFLNPLFGIPEWAVEDGNLQIFTSAKSANFFYGLQHRMLQICRKNYVYVTSTNRRGLTPARGENGLIEWALAQDVDLFLLPEYIRDKFDRLPRESFPIVEALTDRFVVRREGWYDIQAALEEFGVRVEVDLDKK